MVEILVRAGLCLLLVCVCVSGYEWSYRQGHGNTPTNWGKLTKYATCENGRRQSPINIVTEDTKYDDALGGLKLENYDREGSFLCANNGHAISCSSKSTFETTLTWKGIDYVLVSLHFHWGEFNQQGSEHIVDHRPFPLELHVIHYKKAYGNVGAALKKSDGLLVWSTLYEMESDENEALEKIVNHNPSMSYKGENHTVDLRLESLVDTDHLDRYYHYEGSLTTPGCNEVVMWIISEQRAKVSHSQLKSFRSVYEGKKDTNSTGYHLYNNFRNVQKLNGRTVYSSFESSASSVRINLAFLAFLLALYHFVF